MTPRVHVAAARRLEWALIAFLAAQLAFWVVYRLVNLDEGWYLWAGKEVYQGKVLYRDFAYTQTPLLPYLYGLVQQVLGDSLYLGRGLTAFFGILTALLSAATARQRAGVWAGVWTLLLFSTTFLAVTAFSYTATYALTACCLAAAFYSAATLSGDSRCAAWVAFFVALAVGTRLFAVVVCLPLGLYVVLSAANRRRAAAAFGGIVVLTLAVLLLPFVLAGREAMWYSLIGFHTDRNTWQWHQQVVLKSLWDTGRDLLAPVLGYAAALALLIWRWLRHTPAYWQRYGFEVSVALAVALLAVAHMAPRTAMSYYNTLQMPLVAVLVGITLARATLSRRQLAWLVPTALALQLATQAAAVQRMGLLTWPRSQVETVRAAARELQSLLISGSELLTFDLHLALEAGLTVPDGYEMSIFSYRPTWSDQQASRYRAVNNNRLLADLHSGANQAAAWTRFDQELLYGQRDELFAALRDHYRLATIVPEFGPLRDELYVYLRPQVALPAGVEPVSFTFGDQIELLGYQVDRPDFAPQTIRLTLYWQAAQPVAGSYTVFSHLLDATGALVVGQDNLPCYGTCPTPSWRPGEVIRDRYALDLPQHPAARPYQLEIGVYDSQSMTRLSVVDAAGAPLGDRLILPAQNDELLRP